MDAYFRDQVGKRRAAGPKDDVLSTLMSIEIDGAKLDDTAIASHLAMLIIGGAETFPKTFANALRRLAEHPDQRAECVARFRTPR
jgi:cytochrome P450